MASERFSPSNLGRRTRRFTFHHGISGSGSGSGFLSISGLDLGWSSHWNEGINKLNDAAVGTHV